MAKKQKPFQHAFLRIQGAPYGQPFLLTLKRFPQSENAADLIWGEGATALEHIKNKGRGGLCTFARHSQTNID